MNTLIYRRFFKSLPLFILLSLIAGPAGAGQVDTPTDNGVAGDGILVNPQTAYTFLGVDQLGGGLGLKDEWGGGSGRICDPPAIVGPITKGDTLLLPGHKYQAGSSICHVSRPEDTPLLKPRILTRIMAGDWETSRDKEDEAMKDYYEGKVAAVTGGASGIGLALVEAMLEMGARAVTMADINEANLAKHVERLSPRYRDRIQGVKTDVTREEGVKAMVDAAAAFGGGRLDLLFNNAGLGLGGAFDQLGNKDWEKAFAINFYGALYGIRAALPYMKAHKDGHILNTASGVAFVNFPLQSMYAATKSALMSMTNSLRYEYWDDGIRFSTVIPGTVATAIWDRTGGAPANAITPEECAAAVLEGAAENKRVIFITEDDRSGCVNMALAAAYMPSTDAALTTYFLGVAKARRAGDFAAI